MTCIFLVGEQRYLVPFHVTKDGHTEVQIPDWSINFVILNYFPDQNTNKVKVGILSTSGKPHLRPRSSPSLGWSLKCKHGPTKIK